MPAAAGVIPFLMFEGQAQQAMELYTQVIPDSEILDVERHGPAGPGPEGTIVLASMSLRGQTVLVSACVALLREWRPDPPPAWVAAVPSLRHPHLVPDFARRLADALDLPFSDVLKKTGSRPEQKTMENSDRQARNVVGSPAVAEDAILTGPVLLVDDVVDSRWTFTVAAWELRRRGCGPVWPLALANAGGRS